MRAAQSTSRAYLVALLLVAAPAGARVELHIRSDGSVLMRNTAPAAHFYQPSRGAAGSARELRQVILQESRRWRLDPDLVSAVIAAESGFNPAAVSHKGAVGLMQLMPATSRRLAVGNPFDPVENVAGGARYLRELLDLFEGRLELALAGYNAGPGAVARYQGVPPYRETRSYVARVLRLYRGPGFRADLAPLDRVGRSPILRRDPRGRLVLTTSPD